MSFQEIIVSPYARVSQRTRELLRFNSVPEMGLLPRRKMQRREKRNSSISVNCFPPGSIPTPYFPLFTTFSLAQILLAQRLLKCFWKHREQVLENSNRTPKLYINYFSNQTASRLIRRNINCEKSSKIKKEEPQY